ncbi:MAG: acyl-CoA dehydrogenase family protein [bacterium]|nr:acyl-CoA dehydrogenase family protein [bacterium]
MFELNEEQQAVQSSVRRFARRELRWHARKLDSAPPGVIDWDILRKSCAIGLFSASLPKPYGGTMDPLSAVIASEEIARWEAGIATLLSANSIAQTAIALSGNTILMQRIFPAVMAAEEQQQPILCALGLTERRVGSDFVHPALANPAQMMVTAKRRGNAYLLSGRKAYCAGGNLATWICVFATLDEDRSPAGLTGFVIPTDAHGFHVSEVLPTMGLRGCPLVEFYVEGVIVPGDYRLTPEGEAHALIQALSARSRYHAAAIAVGIAQGAFDLARQHTFTRVQGGGPIAQHQMVQHMLADMAMQIEAARLLTYKAATTDPPDIATSSMAKIFASDIAVKVATDAVQLMGAYGTTIKSGAEKYFRDAKMTQIFGATNEICRLAVAMPMLRDAGIAPATS